METIIWHELFQLARGLQTVYEAAANIVKSLPVNFDHIDSTMRKWFIVGMTMFFVFFCLYIYKNM